MKKKIPPKTLLVVLVINILTLIGVFIYWYNCNAHSIITELQKDMTALVDTSRSMAKGSIPAAKRSLAQEVNNKYVNEKLRIACNSFLNAWNDKLTKEQAEAFKNNILEQAELLASSYSTRKGNQLFGVLVIWIIVTLFIWLAFFTNLLRDPQGQVAGNNPIEIEKAFWELQDNDPGKASPPFSLSRTQLAVWITIISCVYLYAVLWDRRSIIDINNTALLLMGISAGTFAVGAILDTMEIQQGILRHQERQVSENFFKDIFSDNNGISIHRFQNVVWTVVAIIVYFYRYSNPSDGDLNGLPTLDSTLLALTGISSATYLMLKTRENVSLKKMVTLSIQLLPDKDLPAAVITDIQNLPEGLQKTVIDIFNSTGDPTHAMSNPASPKDSFTAMVEPAVFQKITATWKGNAGGKETTLTGDFTGIIKETPDKQPIQITMK